MISTWGWLQSTPDGQHLLFAAGELVALVSAPLGQA
jgi:hypothetical protein